MRTRTFMAMAVATMVLAACGNNDESDNWAGEIRLSSGLTVQQTDSRAATDIQDSQFANGENIDVFISENTTEGQAENTITKYGQPLVYRADGSGGMAAPSASQPYFPTSGNSVNIHAYYPSGKVNDITAASLSFEVSDTQDNDANYKASDLMYGVPETNPVARTSKPTVLTFKHLLSKITVDLKQGNGSPSLDGAVVRLKSVQRSTTLNPSAGTISAASGTAGYISVMKATKTVTTGSAIVVPQTLKPGFIEVTLANGGVLTSNDFGTVELNGSNVYTYTITVNLTSLDVNSKITPWTGINENHKDGTAEMK